VRLRVVSANFAIYREFAFVFEDGSIHFCGEHVVYAPSISTLYFRVTSIFRFKIDAFEKIAPPKALSQVPDKFVWGGFHAFNGTPNDRIIKSEVVRECGLLRLEITHKRMISR